MLFETFRKISRIGDVCTRGTDMWNIYLPVPFFFCFSGGVPYMAKAFGDMTVAFWGYLVPLSQVVQPAGISQYLLTQEHKSLMGAADCTRSDVWEVSLDKTSWCTCPDRCSVFLFTYLPDELHFLPVFPRVRSFHPLIRSITFEWYVGWYIPECISIQLQSVGWYILEC